MDNNKPSYWRFAAMIGTSMLVMFGLMYLNSYEASHLRWSETRFFMTLIMGAAMAIVMLSFMLGMYKNQRTNIIIFSGSVILFAAALWLVRSQTTVQDQSWMSAMIPHHSIAILTSERADIDDVRVRKLADEIIRAQRREIQEMEWLIHDINDNGAAVSEREANQRPVPDFEGTL
jgi:ABC-type lipoprotein release transport system permease subunit